MCRRRGHRGLWRVEGKLQQSNHKSVYTVSMLNHQLCLQLCNYIQSVIKQWPELYSRLLLSSWDCFNSASYKVQIMHTDCLSMVWSSTYSCTPLLACSLCWEWQKWWQRGFGWRSNRKYMLNCLNGSHGSLFGPVYQTQVLFQVATHFAALIYCMEGTSAVFVHSPLYCTAAARHTHERQVSFSDCHFAACRNEPWLRRCDCPTIETYASESCKSTAAFHLFTPPVSRWTIWFPTRPQGPWHGLRSSQADKTVKTFLLFKKRCLEEFGSDSAEKLAQNESDVL